MTVSVVFRYLGTSVARSGARPMNVIGWPCGSWMGNMTRSRKTSTRPPVRADGETGSDQFAGGVVQAGGVVDEVRPPGRLARRPHRPERRGQFGDRVVGQGVGSLPLFRLSVASPNRDESFP